MVGQTVINWEIVWSDPMKARAKFGLIQPALLKSRLGFRFTYRMVVNSNNVCGTGMDSRFIQEIVQLYRT